MVAVHLSIPFDSEVRDVWTDMMGTMKKGSGGITQGSSIHLGADEVRQIKDSLRLCHLIIFVFASLPNSSIRPPSKALQIR